MLLKKQNLPLPSTESPGETWKFLNSIGKNKRFLFDEGHGTWRDTSEAGGREEEVCEETGWLRPLASLRCTQITAEDTPAAVRWVCLQALNLVSGCQEASSVSQAYVYEMLFVRCCSSKSVFPKMVLPCQFHANSIFLHVLYIFQLCQHIIMGITVFLWMLELFSCGFVLYVVPEHRLSLFCPNVIEVLQSSQVGVAKCILTYICWQPWWIVV